MSWSLPPKDHPIWKLAQMGISLVGLMLVARHGLLQSHAGPDTTDVLGGVLTMKFVKELFDMRGSS